MPVFEALVNSLHAIEETGRDDGRVTVEVLRLSANTPGAQQSLAAAAWQDDTVRRRSFTKRRVFVIWDNLNIHHDGTRDTTSAQRTS